MKHNRIRRLVAEGRLAVGMMLMEFGTRGVAKLIEYSQLDFVQIDMEHSAFGIERIADLIAWFKATDIAPIVRVPELHYHFLAGAHDAGALGIQVANVETAEQARTIVKACKYHPLGDRGLGLTAAHSDFTTPKVAEYLPKANSDTMVLAQIESERGLRNVDEIAAVDGIDCLVVGHNDLTNSLGIHGQFEHPTYTEALRRVISAAHGNRKLAEVHPQSNTQTGWCRSLGYDLMLVDSDVSIFRAGLKSKVDNLRASAGLTTQPVHSQGG